MACAGHDAVQKVTLIPRGQARGLTWFIPGEDPTLISKQQIFARIVGALGGRAAEQIIFGDAEVTTGASSDLQQVGFYACSDLLLLCIACFSWHVVMHYALLGRKLDCIVLEHVSLTLLFKTTACIWCASVRITTLSQLVDVQCGCKCLRD